MPADISATSGASRRNGNSRSFRPGESGNPRGRTPGTRNRVTIDAQRLAARLVDDPEYRERLRKRMIDGTAGALEPLMWFYAKGKPIERVEVGQRNAFVGVTNEELKAHLVRAVKSL